MFNLFRIVKVWQNAFIARYVYIFGFHICDVYRDSYRKIRLKSRLFTTSYDTPPPR